jgi:diadenylate cyclase
MAIEIGISDDLFKSFSGSAKEKDLMRKDFLDVLKMVAPGTSLRLALEDILRARMGTLIVFENDQTKNLTEGGFNINTLFSSQKLVELSKMDGAIILSRDGKRIVSANTMLFPKIEIPTKETGTRHKSAERTAKQCKTLVIAVSERKNKISLYYGDFHYILQNSSEILRRASETLQILEKQREFYDDLLASLNSLELQRVVSTNDVSLVLQRAEIIKRIANVVQRYLIELGKEGSIVKVRLKELTSFVEKEESLILKDYFGSEESFARDVLDKMDFDFLLDHMNISRLLFEELHDSSISPRGLRILGKTNLLDRYIDILLGNFKDLNEILSSSNKKLLEVLGSEAVVAFFQEEMYNLREKLHLGKRI